MLYPKLPLFIYFEAAYWIRDKWEMTSSTDMEA